jgi:hypothetical protein
MVALDLSNSEKMVKKILFSILFVVITSYLFADSWEKAEIIVRYSKNKEYMLIIYNDYPQSDLL